MAFAVEGDWVILTSDIDFFGDGRQFGLLMYSQPEDPRPGDIVELIQAIDDAYESPSDVVEKVPDSWV